MQHLCIDLCAGLGGFSAAFKLDNSWEVVTVDLEKKFKPTIQADINYLPLKESLSPDCLLMSPSCERFSLMGAGWPKHGIGRALSLVGSCLEAVAFLKPKKWLLENPKGRLRWFIGVPRQSIRYSDFDLTYQSQKPTDLWGNIDLPFCKQIRRPRTKRIGKPGVRQTFNFATAYRCNAAERAEIPLGVSQAVKQGVEISIFETNAIKPEVP
jgi:hypothetical protein